MQYDFSFLPLFFITKEKQNSKLLTGLGKASVCQPLANEEDSEKRNNHQSGKEGRQRKEVTQTLQWCILSPGDRSCRSCSSSPQLPCCTALPRDQSHHTCKTTCILVSRSIQSLFFTVLKSSDHLSQNINCIIYSHSCRYVIRNL